MEHSLGRYATGLPWGRDIPGWDGFSKADPDQGAPDG